VNDSTKNIEQAALHYRKGDFRLARQSSLAILEDANASEENKTQAQKILAATGVDPVAKVVFTITALLLAWLIFRYIIN